MVRELPDIVLASVLRVPATLHVQLSLLYQAYHQLAVLAVYPSSAATRSFGLEYSVWGTDAAAAVWPCLRNLTFLKLRGVAGVSNNTAVLGPHLASLTLLQQLDLSENLVDDEGTTVLGPHLSSLSYYGTLMLASMFWQSRYYSAGASSHYPCEKIGCWS